MRATGNFSDSQDFGRSGNINKLFRTVRHKSQYACAVYAMSILESRDAETKKLNGMTGYRTKFST